MLPAILIVRNFYQLPINEILLTLWQQSKPGNLIYGITVTVTVFGTFHAEYELSLL